MLQCRLGVPVHCLQSNGVIIHMTSRTLHNAATLWITYYSTFPAGSRGRVLVGGMGDKVPPLKVVTSKFYAFLVAIHTQYIKPKHWLLKTKTTKHNSNPQIVRQYHSLTNKQLFNFSENPRPEVVFIGVNLSLLWAGMIHQQNLSVTVWCFVGVGDSMQFCPFAT